MNLFRKITLTLLVSLGVMSVTAAPVGAIDVFDACNGNSDSAVCEASGTDDANNIVRSIISGLLWALGVVAVIAIVIGGFKYVTSNGDANKIQAAKSIILYAVIGLVVAMLAQAIVIFVIDWVV